MNPLKFDKNSKKLTINAVPKIVFLLLVICSVIIIVKYRNVEGIKTVPKKFICLLIRANSRFGEIYKRKYPRFQIVKQKQRSEADLFNFLFGPLIKIKIPNARFSRTAKSGNIEYIFIVLKKFFSLFPF